MLYLLLLHPLHWAVPTVSGYDFYTLFYVLACALNIVLLVWEGHRRGYPIRTWLLLLACTMLPFILGTKLLAFTGPEWHALLTTSQWPASEARTILGGALAGALTLLALRRPFGFGWQVLDAFALPTCAMLVVQCLGCVLTGCCFGEPTVGGWGITYLPNTLPYLVQFDQGLLPLGAAHSLPVHPTQLYALLLCAGVGAVLVLVRRCSWPGGSRLLLQTGLLLAGRFVIEFWRDPAGEPVGAATHTLLGLRMMQLQWALLLLTPMVLGLWLWLVRRARHTPIRSEEQPQPNPVRNVLAVAVLLALTAWLGQLALSLPEVVVVKALLLIVLVLEGGALLLGADAARRPARVAVPLGLASVVLVLTSQAPADTAKAGRESYTTVGVGLSAGSMDRNQNTEGGCGGGTPLRHYQHRYQTATIDVAQTVLPGTDEAGRVHKAEITTGIRLHVGRDQQIPQFDQPLEPGVRKNTLLFNMNPYVQLDREKIGLGMGLMFGHLGYHRIQSGDDISVIDAHGSLRVGPRRILFAQADYNYLGYGTGNPQHRLGLGTGFGGSRWQLQAGAASVRSYDLPAGSSRWSGYVEAQASLTPRWQAGTFLTLGNRDQQQVGLRISRRFLRGK